MNQQATKPRKQPGLDGWMSEDLQRSGLTEGNFTMEPLESDEQLSGRLGFTRIGDTRIMDVGSYWIPYPNVPGYYRLKLREKIGDIKYLSPKGQGNHPYILPEVARLLKAYSPDKPVFITEGEKKAGKATIEGFPCVGLSGVWNFRDGKSDFIAELGQYIWTDRTVYPVFDSDIVEKEGVKRAELRLAVELINRGAKVYSVRLPNEEDRSKNGLDDYLVKYGSEAFRKLMAEAKPTIELCIDGDMRIERLVEEISRLTSSLNRDEFISKLAKAKKVPVDTIRNAVNKQRPKEDGKDEKRPEELFTPEETKKAQDILKSPDILSKMVELTTRIGYVGEKTNKQMLYLSFTSRKRPDSISTLIKGPSASGKSGLANAVLGLFPKTDILSFSFVTSKALVHWNGDLSHKILCIQEHSGSQAADYSIRTTLSEGEISIAIPIKDETTGNFTTIEKRIPAKGLVFVETTTRERVHAENQTRVFDLYMDESQEQTERILKAQAKQDDELSPELEAEMRVWRAAQTLLESYSVYIPYADKLAQVFPKEKPRVRRDFKRFLALIKTHCLLYQFQREKTAGGQLIATPGDLKAVLPIAEVVLIQSHKEISPKLEGVLITIKSYFGVNNEFTFGEIEEKNTIKERTLRRYLRELVENDLVSHNGKTGKESRYTLLSALSSLSLMKNFSSNALKILGNNEDKTKCPQMSPMSSEDSDKGIRDNEDNRGQGDVSSKNFNGEKQLDEKPLFEDKRKEDIEKGDMPNYLQGVEP